MGIKLSGKIGCIAQVVTDNVTISGNGKADNPISLNEDGLNEADKYFVSESEKQKISDSIISVETDGDTISGDGKETVISINETKLNTNDKYFISSSEKNIINETRPIEFGISECVNGIILLETFKRLYRIVTSEALSISLNTSQVDLTKYVRFALKINLNQYVSLTFPENWRFNNFAIPHEIGEYIYDVQTTDGGTTWHAVLIYRNVFPNYVDESHIQIDENGQVIENPVSIANKIVYVDGEMPDDTGNGLTWATAKKELQSAIDSCIRGDSVFVKGSLTGLKYLPTTQRIAGDNTSKSFVMKNGVNIYGGFFGNEVSIYQREMEYYIQNLNLPSGVVELKVAIPKYKSILSGEVSGNSVIDDALRGCKFTEASMVNNSRILIDCSAVSTAIKINGFDLIGCCQHINSGVVYSSRPMFTDFELSYCRIYNNRTHNITTLVPLIANSGRLFNCIVNNNDIAGGLIGATSTTHSIIRNNSNNVVLRGIFINNHKEFCAICENILNFYSGEFISGLTLHCDISSNISKTGETIRRLVTENATNCTVRNNTGSAFFRCVATNCHAYNNLSGYGAGFYDCIAKNCVAKNNESIIGGGGFYLGTAINCTSIRNKSMNGAGSYNTILKNTAVWGNRTPENVKSNVFNDNESTETYSAFENEVRAGDANISLSTNNTGDSDSPCFNSLSYDAGITDAVNVCDERISADSALIDRGNSDDNNAGFAAAYDVRNMPRKDSSNIIDIGAVEFQK